MTKNAHRANFSKDFLRNLIRTKNPDEMLEEAKSEGLEKTLTAFDLIILGVGAIIGSGIFAVVGIAAAGGPESVGAGPSLMLSMIVAAVACIFSALCYSEFAAMIPVAGGAYTYTFATLGEFAAWMVGWILMLEYAVGYIAVAVAWSKHLMQFLKGFESFLPTWFVNPPVWLVNDLKTATKIVQDSGADLSSVAPTLFGIPISFNLPAILVIVAITLILIKGTKDSTKMAGVMVFIKLAVIALFVIAGAFYVKPSNWVPFAPNGFEGMFMGAFIIFFAYIGFDALATTAEECKNPQKDLPVGIIGSLVVTTIVYVLVALILTGMYPTSGHVAQGFLDAPMAYLMSMVKQDWIAGLISIGALAGLTSVLLVLQLAATRILYAMSRDNFLSKRFQKLHPKFHTPHILTWVVAVIAILGSLSLNLSVAATLCNFGTLTAFIIVCVAVLILRKTDPERHRPFKVPFSPFIPSLGIISCGGLMIYSMTISTTSALLFPLWLGIGALIYFHYGYKKNRKAEFLAAEKKIEKESEIKLNEKQSIIS
jgi:APA family basic amino acid/polyamine antiporter